MKILGMIIIAFGLVDLIGSHMEFDLWGSYIGVQLPEQLWQFSSYIEIAIGYLVIKLAPGNTEEAVES
ncbi:hypothetical protein A9R01_17615 ['Osedax' symbiont bacterium Rs2_46_30_T18]|nr:hypothetical protein A9R01_17615 ['Osedax' symbiont bacterium Rs2_46_30_T18]